MTIALTRPVAVPPSRTDGFVERRQLRRLGLRKSVPFARMLGVVVVDLIVESCCAGRTERSAGYRGGDRRSDRFDTAVRDRGLNSG
ncbi:hypothetical protein [Nocardia sp. NPDC057455]|uniref:hypothetical protein n=1 Tax=Nocardia sp. NPDC057455 TaxID=3346138 RepID=UPI00366FA9DE